METRKKCELHLLKSDTPATQKRLLGERERNKERERERDGHLLRRRQPRRPSGAAPAPTSTVRGLGSNSDVHMGLSGLSHTSALKSRNLVASCKAHSIMESALEPTGSV